MEHLTKKIACLKNIFQAIFVFQCPYNPVETEMGRHQMIRGDGVKDIAFTVEDCRALYKVSICIITAIIEQLCCMQLVKVAYFTCSSGAMKH